MKSPRSEESADDARGTINDRRVRPRGVLPRGTQSWIMAGLAVVILAVILFTGNPAPHAAPQALSPASQPAPTSPELVRSYQRELAEREVRGRVMAQQAATLAAEEGVPIAAASPRPADPLVEERRRREYESLFAANVAHSTRSGADHGSATVAATSQMPLPSPLELAEFQQALAQQAPTSQPGQPTTVAPGPPVPKPPAATPPMPSPVRSTDQERAAPSSGLRILEGTFIETVLLNRLDGTFSGPVMCLVTSPIYAEDRQSLLIPSGARLLGAAEPVEAWGESRLAIAFHRLLLPNGQTVDLDGFKGLNQTGETGLKDRVDRHYMQVFGASLAIGAISGLAQWDTRGGFTPGFGDVYRQSAGSSLAASSARVLDRFLNVLPTITIREGHRIKVYLTNDLYLPPFDGDVRGTEDRHE